jgi:hypothetical protein
MRLFAAECDLTKRKWLFVQEADRLRCRYMNPDICSMLTISQKSLASISNGTALVHLSSTSNPTKTWVAVNNYITLVLPDSLSDLRPCPTAAVVTSRDQEKLRTVPINIDINEAALQYEVVR